MIPCPRCESPVDEKVLDTCPLCYAPLKSPEVPPLPLAAAPPAVPPLPPSAPPPLPPLPTQAMPARPAMPTVPPMPPSSPPQGYSPPTGAYSPGPAMTPARPAAPAYVRPAPAASPSNTTGIIGAVAGLAVLAILIFGGVKLFGKGGTAAEAQTYLAGINRSDPKAVTVALYDAYRNQNWKRFFYLCHFEGRMSAKTARAADEFTRGAERGAASVPDAAELIRLLRQMTEIQAGEPNITGDRATVPTSARVNKDGGSYLVRGTARLIKVDGKWELEGGETPESFEAAARELLGTPDYSTVKGNPELPGLAGSNPSVSPGGGGMGSAMPPEGGRFPSGAGGGMGGPGYRGPGFQPPSGGPGGPYQPNIPDPPSPPQIGPPQGFGPGGGMGPGRFGPGGMNGPGGPGGPQGGFGPGGPQGGFGPGGPPGMPGGSMGGPGG